MNGLSPAISLGSKSSLAQSLHNDPTSIDLNLLKDAMSKKDIALILTFYFHHEKAKKIIQDIATDSGDELFQKKLHGYELSFQDYAFDDKKSWDDILESRLNKWDDLKGDTELHTAIRRPDTKRFAELLEQGADIYAKNARGITPVHLAATLGDGNGLAALDKKIKKTRRATPGLRKLITPYQLDMSVVDNDGESPLHVAAQNTHPEVLEWICKSLTVYSSEKNRPDSKGLTPLHKAVLSNVPQNVKILVKEGADRLASAKPKEMSSIFKGMNGFEQPLTPLWLALETSKFDVIPDLITSKEQLLQTTSSSGMTAVHLAAFLGKTQQLKKWRDQFGLKISHLPLRDKYGRTPLHLAAMGDNLSTVELLLRDYSYADVDEEGLQPLHYACLPGNKHVVKYFTEKYKSEQQDKKQANWLSRKVNGWLVSLDLNAKNKKGLTPYMVAHQSKNTAAIEALEDAGCDKSSFNTLLAKAITHPSYRNGAPTELEALIAEFSDTYADITRNSKDEKNNLIHLCAKHMNHKMALILLHPLTMQERREFCSKRNEDGKTPFEILTEEYNRRFPEAKTKKPHPLIQSSYDKFRRLLLSYDDASYKREVKGIDRARYHFHLTQDKREELMASDGYAYAANLMTYGVPAVAFVSNWAATGHLFCGIEAAISAHFGVDVYERTDRIIQHTKPYLPQTLQRPATWAQNFVWGMGMYRNTTMRVAVEATRQTVALGLTKLDPADYGYSTKNYFSHTNWVGALYFAAEELGGRQLLAPIIKDHFYAGFEDYFRQKWNFLTINELTEIATNKVNDVVKDYLKIDLKQKLAEAYKYFRKEIAGVKPSDAQLHDYFKENIAPQIKENVQEKDPDVVKLIVDGAEIIFKSNYDADESVLTGKFNDWLKIANVGYFGDINYELLNSVGTELAKNGVNYGEAVSKILLQPNMIAKYGLTPAVQAQITAEFMAKLNDIQSQPAEAQAAALGGISKDYKDRMDSVYIQSRKGGQEAYNEYQNALRDAFGDNWYHFVSADGAAEYLTTIVIKNNPYFFTGLTPKEIVELRSTIKKTLLDNCDGTRRHLEGQIGQAFNNLNIFFGSRLLNPLFEGGVSLTFDTRTILTQYEPVEARAAFAVHQIQSYLSQSEGYYQLSDAEQLNLYFKLIAAQSAGSLSKTEKAIHDLTFDALQSHAKDKGNYQPVAGKYTLDEAANHIFVTSRDAAEFRWAGAREDETRRVPVKEDSAGTRFFRFMRESTSGNVGVGGVTNGSTTALGVYDFKSGQLSPWQLNLGFAPAGNFTFNMPGQSSSTQTVPAQAIESFIASMTNTNVPVSPMNALWQETVNNAMDELYHLPTQQDYMDTFVETMQKHEAASVPTGPENILRSVADAAVEVATNLSSTFANVVNGITSSPTVAKLADAMAENSKHAASVEPELPRIIIDLNPIKDAGAAVPLAVIAAEAAPVVVPELVAAGVTAGTYLAALFAGKKEDDKEENGYTFPIHQEKDAGYNPGGYSDPTLSGPTVLVTPAEKVEPTIYTTPVDQPGKMPTTFTSPIRDIPGMLLHSYFRYKNSKPEASNVESTTGRIYDDSYQKHKSKAGGDGAYWEGASVNPIPDANTGQRLLDTAYPVDNNKDVLLNYYNGSIIKFRTSNDGRWHAYEVNKGVNDQIDNSVLKSFLNDGLISKAEYKKLLKK